MGEKPTRDAAYKAGVELLQPRLTALENLAVAAKAASETELAKLIADAEAEAAAVIERAHKQVAARLDDWRDAHRAAIAAGWKAAELQNSTLNLRTPPTGSKLRRSRNSGTARPRDAGNPVESSAPSTAPTANET